VLVPIDDAEDPRLAPFRSVGEPAALERAGLFVAEGRLVVARLIEDARFTVAAVLVTPAAYAALADRLEASDAPVFIADQRLVNAITGFNFHRGCLALGRRSSGTASLEQFSRASRLLALEGVGNPDNVGGLFRTACALGAEGIVLDRASGDPLYRKAVRTSMAATLRLPFVRVPDLAPTLPALRGHGFRIVALTPHEDAEPLPALDAWRRERLVLAVGSEGAGLSSQILNAADARARIPVDPRSDSFNVVTAASIALYTLRPQ
jgi:tRNA G18 (ribose-2'-O)-methylase SpoU